MSHWVRICLYTFRKEPHQVLICLANGGSSLHSPVYHLLAGDLRRPPAESLAPSLQALLSPKLPTLLIFECVLAYISPAASGTVLQWFTDYFSTPPTAEGSRGTLGCLVYEMFALEDAFGKVMVNNLKVVYFGAGLTSDGK